MAAEIVPIAESHAEGFHACLDAVARERRYLAQVQAPPLERLLAFVREGLAQDVAQFVALDGGRVVGWCDIVPAWAHAVRHRGTVGMGVLASHRGRGVGEALLRACLAKARAAGLTRIALEVRVDNLAAIRLYERVGFQQEARLRDALRLDGQRFDAFQMSLVFDGEP